MPRNRDRNKAEIRANRAAIRARRTRRPSDRAAFGLLAAILTVAVGGPVAGHFWRNTLPGYACQLTGCTAYSMTVAGWLTVTAPVLLGVTTALLWKRLREPYRIAAAAVTVLAAVLAAMYLPGRRRDFADMIDGLTEDAFATGLRWGGLSLLAVAVIALAGGAFSSGLPPGRWRHGTLIASALAALTLLGVGMNRAWMPPMTAAAIFPAPWSAAGDTLTVLSTADRSGCDGLIADGDLLNGCLRTASAVVVTDDSDAEVHLAAVLFASADTAQDRRAALPDGTAQQAVPGDTASTRTVARNWLILTSVRHRDGREIAQTDRGHLLWTLKQVGYRFTNTQMDAWMEPEPDDGIEPRTP